MRIFMVMGLVTLGFVCGNVIAAEDIDKKWELGFGIGDISSPDYRGSNEYRNYIAPIPYIIYRGKYIQSDRDGIKGNIFKSDQLEFTFSATATISQKADENKARENMPKLGSTVEVGPALNIKLSDMVLPDNLVLQLPVYAVIAVTGSDRGFQGLTFQPQLIYRDMIHNWQFTQRVGLSIASREYHDYYYSVAQEYATPERNFFDAPGGYSGLFTQAAISRSMRIFEADTKLAFFLRYDNIDNTAFAESPLVKTNHVLRGGFAFVWVIK